MADATTLALSEWSCAAAAPGSVAGPGDLTGAPLQWLAARVPGSAGAALRDAGLWTPDSDRDLDAEDWWFRCEFALDDPDASWTLQLGGLATMADVWLNGAHLLTSTNMHRAHAVPVDGRLGRTNELVVRAAALGPLLTQRRPRPRWRAPLVAHHNLRWFRTSLLGRMPGWGPPAPVVGPWRPVELRQRRPGDVVRRAVRATLDGDAGVVDVDCTLRAGPAPESVTILVGGVAAPAAVEATGGGVRVAGRARIDGVEPWWPATHGGQPLFPVQLDCRTGGRSTVVDLGRVGFRTVEFGPTADPEVRINGVPVFCRGACWTPCDPLAPHATRESIEPTLRLARTAGMNTLHILGTHTYENDSFFDACDELGLLVFQDLMLAVMDYPVDDAAFRTELLEEIDEALTPLGGHPSLLAVAGGSEVLSQAAMMGQEADAAFFTDVVGPRVAATLPATPYWANTPVGGVHPFSPDSGLTHYFGVGAYRRRLEDVRLSGVAFATECLALSHVPDDEVIDQFRDRGWSIRDHHWSRRIVHDRTGWTSEDTREHYTAELLGADAGAIRVSDTERYLEVARATSAELMARGMAEFRRPGGRCRGALVLSLRDLFPGAGVGVLDASGRPKAAYYGLARVQQPVALLMSDEGLNGLDVCAINETEEGIEGTLTVAVFVAGQRVGEASAACAVAPRSVRRFSAEQLLGRFEDVTFAYRFGRRADAVAAHWSSPAGPVARAVYIPPGSGLEGTDPGLAAQAWETHPGGYAVRLTSERLARCTVVEALGCRLSDNFIDIEPGGEVTIAACTSRPRLQARVRCLTAPGSIPVTVLDEPPRLHPVPTPADWVTQ